jgi:hypothetical protein
MGADLGEKRARDCPPYRGDEKGLLSFSTLGKLYAQG